MAGARKSDLLGRLADISEEAIQRLEKTPGADRVVGTVNALRDRLDELQRRVRGLEQLEQRIAALEKKVDKLAKAGGSSAGTARRGSSSKSSTSKGSSTKKS